VGVPVEIWSAIIGAFSGAITGWLTATYQARTTRREALLARFDDALNAAISEATILWSRDSGESEPERAAQLRATHLRLSGCVEDILRHPRVPDQGWALRVYRALTSLRSESTGGAFDSAHRRADPERSRRIREAGGDLRETVRQRLG
jgi:hypothetical protein